MECIRFVVRQGLAFRGNDGNDNLTKLFKQLNKNDPPLLIRLDKESHLEPGQDKYIHNDIHNELIEFMEFRPKKSLWRSLNQFVRVNVLE